MPRARDVDRLKLEAYLTAEEIGVLHEHCCLLGIDPDHWHRVPALRRVWQTVIVARVAARVASENPGLSRSWVLKRACALSHLSARANLDRWFQQGLGEADAFCVGAT